MVTTNNELLTIMKRVGNVTTQYHQKDSFVGGLYDVTAPSSRVEVWNMATRIDIYIGKLTPMYSTMLSVAESESDISRLQLKVKKSKNEICVKLSSLKAFELLMTTFYSQEYKDSLKATQTATQPTKKRRTNKRKTA